MSATDSTARSRFGRSTPVWLGVVLVTTGIVALPWWRNHAFLRDFYDYGLVIAASCRMALGEMPYVDFTTPIQTLHFLQARGAEMIFGPHYLSLTYANLIFIAAAFWGMVAVLRRPLGWLAAVLVAAAVVTASSGQHTIVWHNAMGVTWASLIVWLTARSRPASAGRLLLVCALLWLGGMTKITYQITALAFATLFALRDGWMKTWSGRRVALALGAYLLFGLVVPFATELLYTGAGPSRWWQNVVLTPERRLDMVWWLTQPGFYFKTAHDYYRPLYLPFAGAWGVVVLALAAGISLRAGATRWSGRLFLGVLFAGAWICAGVLQATNLDIVYLGGAMWLALGTGIVLALAAENGDAVGRVGRVVLGVAAVTLLVPAWISAWQGTRALWGHGEEGREQLVSTDDLPENYAYFRGMRIPAPLHESLVAYARQPDANDAYFTNGTEFMLRAFPGKRFRGIPLWLHEGTTYGAKGARLIQAKLTEPGTRLVVSHGNWNEWRHGTDWYLQNRFHYDRVGPMLHIYRDSSDPRRNWHRPAVFAVATESGAYLADIDLQGGPFTLARANAGPAYLGAPRTGRLVFRAPVNSLSGELVARRAPAAGQSPLDLVWRVVARQSDGTDQVLRDERIVLAPDELERIVSIQVDTGGRPAALELFLPPDERVEAGFRRLQAEYAGTVTDELPQLLDEKMSAQPNPETWSQALFADDSLRATPRHGEGFGISPNQDADGPQLFAHTPGVVWFKLDAKFRHLAGEFGLGAATWTDRDALNGVRAQVIFYRPGQLQVLVERELRPKERTADRVAQKFEVEVPGKDGWVALVFTTLDNPRNNSGHSWWRQLRAW